MSMENKDASKIDIGVVNKVLENDDIIYSNYYLDKIEKVYNELDYIKAELKDTKLFVQMQADDIGDLLDMINRNFKFIIASDFILILLIYTINCIIH